MYCITSQIYFSLYFSVLDFSEYVLHSHLNVSVTIVISFRSQQAETRLFGGKDGRSITPICAVTVALIRTVAKMIPTGVIAQEASPQEMKLHVTMLQTATGLQSFLTQTQTNIEPLTL